MKNLLRQAEHELEGVAIRGTDAASLLKPARDLLSEPSFWEHASDGLAVFLAPGFDRMYRLPVSFQEKCVVSGAFHVKSLLPLLSGDGQFYIPNGVFVDPAGDVYVTCGFHSTPLPTRIQKFMTLEKFSLTE